MAKAHKDRAVNMEPINATRWYNAAEVAALLGLTETQLSRWRMQRIGPPFVKIGNTDQSRVAYPEPGLIEWQKKIEMENSVEVEKAS